MKQYLLIFSCTDTFGIIAKVTAFLSEERAFIEELSEFGDPTTSKFFLRCQFRFPEKAPAMAELSRRFEKVAAQFNAAWKFIEMSYQPKVMIAVSKFGHCLNDLLYRVQSKRLEMKIECVVSNHQEFEKMVRSYDIAFYYLPIENKKQQEEKILSLIEERGVDLLILARYMQILSPSFTQKLSGKIINIHHSFLPSFKGAKPYHQAYERGVKIIGATAHYVTENLDEGPIIEQEVIRVDHTRSPEELVSRGHDVETQVLARAVKYHIENRIFLNGNKTIIFK